MAGIEDHKESIKRQLGDETLDVLRTHGIDVDAAIRRVLEGQASQKARLDAKARKGDVRDMMTSELTYRAEALTDPYGQEYLRRLRLIGLSDDQVTQVYSVEQVILSVQTVLPDERKQPWVRRIFLTTGSTPDTLPEKRLLTLSELVLITDDANGTFLPAYHVFSDTAWTALCIAACCAPYAEARYAKEFEERTTKLGWSEAQCGAYSRNECFLLERLKWGMGNPPAWTPETCDLRQYQRKSV
ncbi:MAG: hypothetical protein V1735_04690 [Nanoarchaeota archaeon]